MPRRSAYPLPAFDAATGCPCGLDQSYSECCGNFHTGQTAAPTPETLMRSRFTAYTMHNQTYLLHTWHPTTRPPRIQFDPELRWSQLHILATTGGSLLHTEGTVEFRADYSLCGQPGCLHEHSRFVRDGGTWVYLGPIPLA